MNDVLAQIVAATRARLVEERLDARELCERARETVAGRTQHAFAAALRQPGVNVIAEIKSASPSAGSIVGNPDVAEIAAAYAEGGAAAISIVTEPQFFRGSRSWLTRAREAAGRPVIMKDFIVDDAQLLQAIASGPDAVLLLASLLDAGRIRDGIALLNDFGCDALVEVHDEAELERALAAEAPIIGVNNRDLKTFRVYLTTSERLGARIPEGVIRVAESGIAGPADVERLRAAGFHAFLVGESLLRQNDRAAAVRGLRMGGGAA